MNLKKRLQQGETLLGTLLSLPSPEIAEIMSQVGFDWSFIDLEPLDAFPDGATVDSEGCLWSALVTKGQVGRFSPEGALMHIVDVPADHPSSVMFGGPDLDVLFVTSIWEWRQVKTENPADGCLYAIHGLEVTGLPEPRFAG